MYPSAFGGIGIIWHAMPFSRERKMVKVINVHAFGWTIVRCWEGCGQSPSMMLCGGGRSDRTGHMSCHAPYTLSGRLLSLWYDVHYCIVLCRPLLLIEDGETSVGVSLGVWIGKMERFVSSDSGQKYRVRDRGIHNRSWMCILLLLLVHEKVIHYYCIRMVYWSYVSSNRTYRYVYLSPFSWRFLFVPTIYTVFIIDKWNEPTKSLINKQQSTQIITTPHITIHILYTDVFAFRSVTGRFISGTVAPGMSWNGRHFCQHHPHRPKN